MATHNVFIFCAGSEYRVRPAAAVLDKSLKIRNITPDTAILMFPAGFIVEGDTQTMSGGDKKTFNFTAAAKDSFTYSVTIVKNGQLIQAKGDSEPVIIIDP